MTKSRYSIRRMLLESFEQHYEKIAFLLSGGLEDIKQGIELAEAIGLIRVTETPVDDKHRIAYYSFRFVCLEEDFGPFLREYKKAHGTHTGVRWSLGGRNQKLVDIMVIEDRGVNWVSK